MDCPGRDRVEAWSRGELPVAERDLVGEHVAGCATCGGPTLRMASPPASAAPRGELAAGTRVGRFVVERLLGEGGMGMVYVASDPELGRRVALKLLRGGTAASPGRLLREAQVLARLSHPNVVVVHEVGTHLGQVFMAMELVDGVTLLDWQRAARREVAAILEVYAQAGRGLAAAHAAGVVHRDFKPANVLVDARGRARVADFGLARTGASGDPASGESPSSPSTIVADAAVTAAGAVVGTPAYMSPEQRRGEPATPASDQFSFCVALVEALWGTRPAAGHVPPPRRGLSARLRRALARGLRADPAERHPSVDALLAALDGGGAARARVALAAGGLALLAAGVTGYMGFAPPRPDPCAAVVHRLDGVWDAPRRAALRAAYLATGAPYAAPTYAGVERLVNAYAAGWVDRYAAACRAPGPAAARGARLDCLEERFTAFAGVLRVLAPGDARAVAAGPETVAALDDLARCDMPGPASAPVPQEPALRTTVLVRRARLAQLHALAKLGPREQVIGDVQEIVADARRLGYRPLEAEALAELSTIYVDADQYALAEEAALGAGTAAKEVRYDLLEARAWRELVFVYNALYRPDDQQRAARYARAVFKGLGPEADHDRIALDAGEAYRLADGKHPELGLPLALHALALAERRNTPGHPQTAAVHNAVAYVQFAMRDFDGAERHFRAALDTMVALAGELHPSVAKAFNNLANVAFERGDFTGALAQYRHALELKRRLGRTTTVDVGYSRFNIGLTLQKLGRHAEALEEIAAARAILVDQLGGDKSVVADVLAAQGESELALGRPDDARRELEAALAIRERLADGDKVSELRKLLASVHAAGRR